jgi:hypothetical protein
LCRHGAVGAPFEFDGEFLAQPVAEITFINGAAWELVLNLERLSRRKRTHAR